MRNLWPMALTCLALLEGFCGCRSVYNPAHFSETPETNNDLQEVTVCFEVTGIQPGVDPSGLANAIRRSYGLASNVYPPEAMDRNARALAQKIIRGEKVVFYVRQEYAHILRQKFQQARIILRATE